jgi:glycosyltransferase involved in cell wall biosynthesis
VDVLFLADRLSVRGGADLHLLQVVEWAVLRGFDVTLAVGRIEDGATTPDGVRLVRVRGLATAVESSSRLRQLEALLHGADVIHIQNVMNPEVLRRAAAAGRTIATIQDHRVFCPGMGKTMPDGRCCRSPMAPTPCRECVPDSEYRERVMALTAARLGALDGVRLIVLSSWMADELAAVGLTGAHVIPPWVAVGSDPRSRRSGFVIGGRLVAHKGVLDGWSAWRRSRCDEPLWVVGDGPLAHRLTGTRRLGWLSPFDLRRKLRSSIGLLFPSRWQEPFGMLGVEALAEGTPVVVAESGGTSEWSTAGCIRVRPSDIEAMTAAVDLLVDDPQTARRLGNEGREMVEVRFSRESVERRLDDVYSSVARRQSP